jgi:lysozyme family protein
VDIRRNSPQPDEVLRRRTRPGILSFSQKASEKGIVMLQRALTAVLKWEGGYVNHPSDPGGATNMGITQKTLEGWRGAPVTAEDVKALIHEEAEAIYEARYWSACRCDAFRWPVALMVFDAAVNHGPGRAARLLQEALGVTADGAIGPVTLGAAQTKDPASLATEIAARRMVFYGSLKTFKTFGLGWSRRLMDVLGAALTPER